MILGQYCESTISIHALLAESDFKRWCVRNYVDISIHALLAESDRYVSHMGSFAKISIHALLAESDARTQKAPSRGKGFLSTLSLRRATCPQTFFCASSYISIHALLAESDASTMTIITCIASFLSTLSLRRATKALIILPKKLNDFYPRSPCGERRSWPRVMNLFCLYFYPRSPCGERPLT